MPRRTRRDQKPLPAKVRTALPLLAAAACADTRAVPGRAAEPVSLGLGGWFGAAGRLAVPPERLLTTLAAVVGVSGGSALLFWLPAFLERGRGASPPGRARPGCRRLGAGGVGAGALRQRTHTRPPGPGPAAGGTGAAALATAAALRFPSPDLALPCVMIALLGLFTGPGQGGSPSATFWAGWPAAGPADGPDPSPPAAPQSANPPATSKLCSSPPASPAGNASAKRKAKAQARVPSAWSVSQSRARRLSTATPAAARTANVAPTASAKQGTPGSFPGPDEPWGR